MSPRKYLTLLYTFLFICIIPILRLSAQDWNYQMGLNAAHLRFQSPAGIAQNSIRPDAGLHLSIYRTHQLLDSSKTPSAFLRKLDYQVGLAIDQFNAVGETQNIPFSYTSTYVGLNTGLGIKSHLGRGISVSYGGTLQVKQLILGAQKMGNQVYDLQGNPQFDRILWQVGAQVKLAKQLNDQVAIYAFFSNNWQLNTNQKDGSQFAINPVSFGFGIQYSLLK